MPRGLRTFRFSVEAHGRTRFGGLSLFQQFCKALGLRRFLQTYVRWPASHHRTYHPADLFLAHVVAIVAGIGRIENTPSLLSNGLIPPLLGLPECPHRDTRRSFLWRFEPAHWRSLEHAHDRCRAELFQRLGRRYSAIVDAATLALITSGHQEGVARGYLPKRRHRKSSYAPLLSSEGRSGLSLGMALRAGNVPPVTGSWPFLHHQLEKRPNTIARARPRVRLDGAFYDKDVPPLDDARISYVMVAKRTAPLPQRMIAAKYPVFREGWEAAAFPYPPFRWNEEHRCVTVRRPIAYEPEEAQATLFTFRRDTYQRAVVTNLDLSPAAVWRFYCDRAAQELLRREFKTAYAMARIPTKSFWANAASMETILWAYDLVRACQLLCLPPPVQHWNIATVRRELWGVPAEWIKRGNRNTLRLPARYPHLDLLRRIQSAIARLKPLL